MNRDFIYALLEVLCLSVIGILQNHLGRRTPACLMIAKNAYSESKLMLDSDRLCVPEVLMCLLLGLWLINFASRSTHRGHDYKLSYFIICSLQILFILILFIFLSISYHRVRKKNTTVTSIIFVTQTEPVYHTQDKMITLPRRNLQTLTDDSPSASSFKKEAIDRKKPRDLFASVDTRRRRGVSDELDKKITTNQTATEQQEHAEPPKKMVTFAKTAKVKKVRSRAHFTAAERDAMWLAPDDYVFFKKDALETLKHMHQTATVTVEGDGSESITFYEDDDHTMRGLESRTKEAATRRKEFKAYSRELVLEEQENQREAGVVSDERLRNAYLETSVTAIQQARWYGEQDEDDVSDERLASIMRQVKQQYGWR